MSSMRIIRNCAAGPTSSKNRCGPCINRLQGQHLSRQIAMMATLYCRRFSSFVLLLSWFRGGSGGLRCSSLLVQLLELIDILLVVREKLGLISVLVSKFCLLAVEQSNIAVGVGVLGIDLDGLIKILQSLVRCVFRFLAFIRRHIRTQINVILWIIGPCRTLGQIRPFSGDRICVLPLVDAYIVINVAFHIRLDTFEISPLQLPVKLLRLVAQDIAINVGYECVNDIILWIVLEGFFKGINSLGCDNLIIAA